MPPSGFSDYITPIEHFFVRTHVYVPTVNVSEWRLKVEGEVATPLTLTMDDLKKLPSVSEAIDWARVLVLLQAPELGHEIVKDTLNVLLKYEADIEATLPQVSTFIAKASRQNVFG